MSGIKKVNTGSEYPYQYKYPHAAITADCVIFSYEDRSLRVLLVRRGEDPCKGSWAFPGGFLHMDETVAECALRELEEETSLSVASIRELGVFSGVDRDPRERVVTVAFYALVKPSQVVGGDDAAEARWFDVNALPPLAFDHGSIFASAMERLRRDIHFEPVGFELLDDTFTIPDLQCLYEIILGREFDRRNFQRKILSTGILDEAEEDGLCMMEERTEDEMTLGAAVPEPSCTGRQRRRAGRIASLFRFNPGKYEELKEDGDKTEF